jgi:hypothetical protein
MIDQAMAALPALENQGSLKERAVLEQLCAYVLNRDK